MDHRTRFVFAGGATIEETIALATRHDFRRIDFNADQPGNYPSSFDAARIRDLRRRLEDGGLVLGVHTLSAVNMAEITPVMSAAVDEYLRQNLDLAAALGGAYVILHGGFHFGSDRAERRAVAIERLRRAVDLAAERTLEVYLENHNREPDEAEIHYMPIDVAETRRFLAASDRPNLRWAFNVGHAYLVPDGVAGFLAAFGVDRIGQVRLNDNRGRHEEHLCPGEGIVDFRGLFRQLAALGYTGPFTLDFGSTDDRVAWRDRFADWLTEVSPG